MKSCFRSALLSKNYSSSPSFRRLTFYLKTFCLLQFHSIIEHIKKQSTKTRINYSYGEQHVWSIATAYYTKLRQKIDHEEIIASGLLENDRGTIRDCYSLFNREYAWSPGYLDEFENTMEEDCSASIDAKPCSINYLWEEEYDASQEDTTSFLIPCGFIIRSMKLFEKEADGVYYDSKGIAAFSQKEVDYSKSFRFNNLFIRGDILDQFLEKICFRNRI